jgi:serine/threonine protein kinase/class 3 adenylate cyclase
MPELSTFVFTDLAGSVDLKRRMPGADAVARDEAYVRHVLSPHRERIERGLADAGGRVVSTAGDGHFLVFGDTARAAQWALGLLTSHEEFLVDGAHGSDDGTAPAAKVRVALHVGAPQVDPSDPDNYVGRTVDYAARLVELAAPGQALVSRSAASLLEDAGLDGVRLASHGKRRLRDIGEVELFELLDSDRRPTPPRREPAADDQRRWTVLPATMGLTEYAALGSSIATKPAAVEPLLRLGNYQLEELLGAGGMGNVYRARHALFGKERAVKVIKPELVAAGGDSVVRRFYQEVRATGALEHPNLVVAIDSSNPEDDRHYLVMEYIDGVALDRLLDEEGPLAVPEACEVVRQAALGLEHLHARGLVHRDVKPSNLMLTVAESPGSASHPAQGSVPVVKLMDLGLALLVGRDQQRLTRLDQGGMGTGYYMSPEQWRTTSVDIRADIYSLGCTLHHLLTGAPPFADSDLRPEKAHEREAPPRLRGKIAGATAQPAVAELEKLLLRMMAKRPEDRPQRPIDVAEALAPLAEGNQLVEVAKRWRAANRRARTTHSGETRLAAGTSVDTAHPTPLVIPAPPTRRTSRRGLLAALATLASVATLALGWYAVDARTRMLAMHRDSLVRTAKAAANLMSEQVDERFRTLKDLADDEALVEALVAIDATPDDEALWKPIQQWVAEQKSRADNEFVSSSWFVTDRRGVQVARAPASSSVGESYAQRDYFHGQGRGRDSKALDTAQPAPLREPHVSAAYVSSSTGDLKVAFSVPVWNGKRAEAERAVVGVLAMSVSLGEFTALADAERDFRPIEVLLVDLEHDEVQAERRRGLVLHHSAAGEAIDPTNPPRAPAELLYRIDTAPSGDRILESYEDFVTRDGAKRWGAFEPIVIRNPSERRSTGWVIVAQEELP